MTCHDCGAGRLEGALSCMQCLTIYADASIEGHRIESLIGRGGMGQIYLATHPVLERRVAVKVLQLNASGAKAKQELKDRFLREARAMARINHRGIVQVYSAGISGEVPYIIMEYLSGRNLGQVLQKTPIMAVGRFGLSHQYFSARYPSNRAVVCLDTIKIRENRADGRQNISLGRADRNLEYARDIYARNFGSPNEVRFNC